MSEEDIIIKFQGKLRNTKKNREMIKRVVAIYTYKEFILNRDRFNSSSLDSR